MKRDVHIAHTWCWLVFFFFRPLHQKKNEYIKVLIIVNVISKTRTKLPIHDNYG